ncbi:MAG: bifunctional diaminohydroxyphosphoribosylaminopyrimidine deaminase/5-amino-6-(5-phosphoribosylamino)uracil reductase RibD [Pseudomonadales bacterium]|nr:bifunctional diaminohydroxyphosphoribosylaminopyrimidine deaminase/5-amino-6-(5-phosphoribosylamino)uracil reductase RibD [Pseudomonadales bacterium]
MEYSDAADADFMARAIQLAAKASHSTSPNPRVGCVIVKQGKIIGEGYHIRAGQGHAEVNALADCQQRGYSAAGACCYVTLEPCSHTGRTPPCAERLIEAKLARVVIGHQDPNPQVSGNGIRLLQEAGIEVCMSKLAAETEALNPGFCKRMRAQMPRLMAKIASSLDGRSAMASGESQWITGPEARADVQRLRADSCAIITGIGTVLADDPRLSVRDQRFMIEGSDDIRQPLKVIIDSRLQIRPEAKIFAGSGDKLVVFAADPSQKKQALAQLQAAGIATLHLPDQADWQMAKVDLPAVLRHLATLECNEVMLEAGSRLCGVFLQQGLIDEVIFYLAPTLLGSNARPQVELPLEKMAQQLRLDIQQVRPVGNDLRISAVPQY